MNEPTLICELPSIVPADSWSRALRIDARLEAGYAPAASRRGFRRKKGFLT